MDIVKVEECDRCDRVTTMNESETTCVCCRERDLLLAIREQAQLVDHWSETDDLFKALDAYDEAMK